MKINRSLHQIDCYQNSHCHATIQWSGSHQRNWLNVVHINSLKQIKFYHSHVATNTKESPF